MSEFESIFTEAFEFVKKEIVQYHSHADPEEMSPAEKALVLGISKLPLPVEIIDVEVDTQTYPHLMDNICQLIKYNTSKIGEKQVKYCGKVPATKDAMSTAMIRNFGIPNGESLSISEDITEKFGYSGFSFDDGSHVQFTRYDIRNHKDDFFRDLCSLFYSSLNDYIVNKFMVKDEIDFNKLYQLKNDPVLPPSEFLKPDSRSGYFTLEHLQSIVSRIQLIPEVPQSVKVEFQRAKDLFVFSYFRYEFATLSNRSALFAFEVAMRQRYLQSLKGKAIITCDDQIMHELIDPAYSQISEFLNNVRKNKKIKFNNIKVNGEKFPMTTTELIKWMGRNGIPKWKLRFYEMGRKARNSLAHPEHPTIFPPSNDILLQIAYDINELFYSKNNSSK